MDFVEKSLQNGFYLALIYIVISGNYIGNTFGCKVQQLFQNNMLLKHLLALITTYFLIILATPPDNFTPNEIIAFTGIVYTWFFLTTRMHFTFWIPMIITIMGAFVIYSWQKQSKKEENKDENLDKVKKGLVSVAGILTIFGVAVYYGEKKLEYGSKFNPMTFWFGKPQCQGTPYSSPNILKSLTAVFSSK